MSGSSEASAAISADEFQRMQMELITLKQAKYEAKDREAAMTRQLTGANGRIKQLEKDLAKAQKAREKSDRARTKAEDKLKSSKDARVREALEKDKAALQRQMADMAEESKEQQRAMQEANRNIFKENAELRQQVEQLTVQVKLAASSSTSSDSTDLADQQQQALDNLEARKELDELKLRHSELMGALERKNNEIAEKQSEFDRLLQKLSDVQTRANAMQDAVDAAKKQCDEVRAQSDAKVKESDALVSSLQDKIEAMKRAGASAEADSKQKATWQAKVQELSNTAADLHTQVLSLTKKLEVATKEIEEKDSALDALENKYKLQSYSLTEAQETATALQKQVDLERTKLQDQATEHTNTLDRERSDWEERLAALQHSLEQERAANEDQTSQIKQLEEEVAELQSRKTKAEEECQQLKTSLEEEQAKVRSLSDRQEDMGLERKIEAKKRNQLVKELKAQLREVTRRNAELDAELKATNAALDEIRAGGTADPNLASISHHKLSDNQRSRSASQLNSSGKTVESEVSEALAKRLAQVQEEKFAIATKVEFLESNVQLLQEDVDKKKLIIEAMLLKMPTGPLTTQEMLNEAQRKQDMRMKNKKMDLKMKEELLTKMELILQETTLQNIHLKSEKEALGRAVTDMSKQLQALKAESKQE